MFIRTLAALVLTWPVAWAAPIPKQPARTTGILVLDDCDRAYSGKDQYEDNLTFVNSSGEKVFRISGLNNCQSIGCNRMIVADPARRCIWVVENVARRVRRFDYSGKETLSIPVKASAVAIDPETGNAWILTGGQIGKGRTQVFDDKGKELADYNVSGWDIVYDRKTKAFLIAETKLTKISAAKGEVLWSVDAAPWCSMSVDVDPRNGAAWVAVGAHPGVPASRNQLLKFDADGKPAAVIDLQGEGKCAFRVSVDAKDGSVWTANYRKSVEHYSADGQSLVEHSVEAIAVQVDHAGDVWVATSTELQKLNAKGEVTKRVKHAGESKQVWIASLE